MVRKILIILYIYVIYYFITLPEITLISLENIDECEAQESLFLETDLVIKFLLMESDNVNIFISYLDSQGLRIKSNITPLELNQLKTMKIGLMLDIVYYIFSSIIIVKPLIKEVILVDNTLWYYPTLTIEKVGLTFEFGESEVKGIQAFITKIKDNLQNIQAYEQLLSNKNDEHIKNIIYLFLQVKFMEKVIDPNLLIIIKNIIENNISLSITEKDLLFHIIDEHFNII